MSHFVTFLFRFAVIYFNYSSSVPENFNTTKKVLHLLRNIEISESFQKFLKKLNRTYNGQMSFLPSKRLLTEILRNEGMELSMELNGP